jgi:hypothetical protein
LEIETKGYRYEELKSINIGIDMMRKKQRDDKNWGSVKKKKKKRDKE